MSATLACMISNVPIGALNCLRSRTYGMVMSIAACIRPIGPPDSTSRSVSSPFISTRTPSLTSPTMFSAGISQSSNTSSQVFEPRMPSLSSFCAVLKPFMPFSTMKAVMQRLPAVRGAVRM
jgi:hypothetical protein